MNSRIKILKSFSLEDQNRIITFVESNPLNAMSYKLQLSKVKSITQFTKMFLDVNEKIDGKILKYGYAWKKLDSEWH
jgi:hypothetical protein